MHPELPGQSREALYTSLTGTAGSARELSEQTEAPENFEMDDEDK